MGDEPVYRDPGAGGLFDRDWDIDVDAFLDTVADEEATWLENELDRIDQQLANRATIHQNTVNELQFRIDRYAERLDRVDTSWRGDTEEQERLKQRIHQLYEELRAEYREHWQDRQRLYDERRQVLRELDQVQANYLDSLKPASRPFQSPKRRVVTWC